MKIIKTKYLVTPNEKSFLIFQSLQRLDSPNYLIQKNDAFMAKPVMTNHRRTILAASILAATMISNTQYANAALVSACSGVSLPKSVVTDIVGGVLLPITGLLDLGGLLGLGTTINTTLANIAGGAPINLNVLDTNGNLLSPADTCETTADGFSLTTPKGISIGGNSITGLGNGAAANAGELNSIAFGNGSVTDAAAINSMAIGPNAFIGALGTNSMALGSGANANVANSLALGASSTAALGAQTNYTAYGLAASQNSVGEVSFGSAGNARKITNVAAGSADTDVVNVSQLRAVDDGAIKYDIGTPRLKMTATLGGDLSTDGGTTNGTLITNLSKGAINATSTDAVNGSQLFAISNGVTTNAANMDALGLSMAANLGGGAVYNTTTKVVSAPTYNVYGAPHSNVGSAITALQTNAPLQYSDANGVATPGVPSNHVTLVGSTAGTAVTLHNVANGVAANDAVNMSQLAAVQNNVSTLDALAVKYDDTSKDTITFLGTASLDGGVTGGTTLTNLSQGDISEFSTDAINGAQLYATNQMITNLSNGGGIKYFRANSVLADSSATGIDSVAAGPRALASGDGSVAMGDNSHATQTGAIAIGQNAAATGVNSIAIGAGALATGSVAVGVNAQAGNGGAAFGDNAVALTPQQGTALGNAANVTANRGVALGASAQATRAGMNGATEKYSNVAVTSTEGAVSVGSAGNERQITNVAGGTADTDAVNVRQLDAAITQSSIDVNNRLNALQSDISSVRHDAHAGTASAMAMASMPQSVVPGKVMMAAGVANYQGQSAMSVGVSNFSENGRWVVNVNGAANTRGNAGASVGVGFHW
ncbi:MAG: YadA-like family protein [Pseudomonadota bacterium]